LVAAFFCSFRLVSRLREKFVCYVGFRKGIPKAQRNYSPSGCDKRFPVHRANIIQHRIIGSIIFVCLTNSTGGESSTPELAGNRTSKVWVADNGDGTYKNPIIHADYSDPDVIRVADDFYLVASGFNAVPGLPILHSKDLVNWEIIGHGLSRQPPDDVFGKPQHGNGVWAPSIRYPTASSSFFIPIPIAAFT
jgi:hypothetical protein